MSAQLTQERRSQLRRRRALRAKRDHIRHLAEMAKVTVKRRKLG